MFRKLLMITAACLVGSSCSTTPPHQAVRQAFPAPPVDLSTPLSTLQPLPASR